MKFNFGYSKKYINKELGEHKEFYKVYFDKLDKEIDGKLVRWHYVTIVILWMHALSTLYFSLIGGIGAIVLALGITCVYVLYLSEKNNLKYVRMLFYSINIMMSYIYFIIITTSFHLNYMFMIILISLIVLGMFFSISATIYAEGEGSRSIQWGRFESDSDEENISRVLNRELMKSYDIPIFTVIILIFASHYRIDFWLSSLFIIDNYYEIGDMQHVSVYIFLCMTTNGLLYPIITTIFAKYKAKQVIYKEYIEQNNTTNLEDTV